MAKNPGGENCKKGLIDKELLEELYLRLIYKGPGFLNSHNIEFWDPTGDSVAIFEELMEKLEK